MDIAADNRQEGKQGPEAEIETKQSGLVVPEGIKTFFSETGELARFTARFFGQMWRRPYEVQAFLNQCYEVGYASLGLVGVTGFIMGLVLTIQSRPTLAEFGAESWLPGMVSISIFREIGPVITAMICAGKVASRIGAELGSMKVTEQIDAMEVSATNPFKYLVVTRVLACTLMIPLLVMFSDAISLIGSLLAVNIKGEVSFQLYLNQAYSALEFKDIIPATLKTYFFGFAIGIIGCFKGYNAKEGTVGVGAAANSAVVVASLTIFVLDMIAVQLADLFWK